jgi:hypothetical protein
LVLLFVVVDVWGMGIEESIRKRGVQKEWGVVVALFWGEVKNVFHPGQKSGAFLSSFVSKAQSGNGLEAATLRPRPARGLWLVFAKRMRGAGVKSTQGGKKGFFQAAAAVGLRYLASARPTALFVFCVFGRLVWGVCLM